MRFEYARKTFGKILSMAAVPALLAWILSMPAATAGAPPPGARPLLQELEGDYSSLPPVFDPRFGHAIALHGDTLVVGAPGVRRTPHSGQPGSLAVETGAVYVFKREVDTWHLSQRLVPPFSVTHNAARCGNSVAVSEFHLLVGCPFHIDPDSGEARGMAMAYVRSSASSNFVLDAILTDNAIQPGSECGTSVAVIDGAPGTDSPYAIAAVGCPQRRDFPEAGAGNVGGVNIYRHAFGIWASGTSLDGLVNVPTGFGNAVGLSRGVRNGSPAGAPELTVLLAIGNPYATNGLVRLYEMDGPLGNGWTLEESLGGTPGSEFGYSLHMRGRRLAVGAPAQTVVQALPEPPHSQQVPVGGVTTVSRNCSLIPPPPAVPDHFACVWGAPANVPGQVFTPPAPPPQAQNRLGHAVHIPFTTVSDWSMLAGEPTFAYTTLAGRARAYGRDGADWVLDSSQAFYQSPPSGLSAGSEFGWSLAGDENGWVIVGAPGFLDDDSAPRGRVFVYGHPNVLFSDRFQLGPF